MFGLALWLFVLSIYYILKEMSYKLIPVSLKYYSIRWFILILGESINFFIKSPGKKITKEFLTNNAVLNFTQELQKQKKFSLFEMKKISDQVCVYVVERYGENH